MSNGYAIVSPAGVLLLTARNPVTLFKELHDGVWPAGAQVRELKFTEALAYAREVCREQALWEYESAEIAESVTVFEARCWLAVAQHPELWTDADGIAALVGSLARHPSTPTQ